MVHLYPKGLLAFQVIERLLSEWASVNCIFSNPWHLILNINHSRDLLFFQECNYILSNKTWKSPTRFKTQCVHSGEQEGIPSSQNMLTSQCGWTMGFWQDSTESSKAISFSSLTEKTVRNIEEELKKLYPSQSHYSQAECIWKHFVKTVTRHARETLIT